MDTNESPEIELPTDQIFVKRLRAKLEEYRQRADPFKAPEMQIGTLYKIAILEELLKTGKVVTHELSKKLAEKHGSLDPEKFENSCGVIQDYCRTGGQHVRKGCLPKIANS